MMEVNHKRSFRELFYPSCPFNNSIILTILRLGIIVLGTYGISFFSIWIAGAYLLFSIVYNGFIWPVIHCQHCYYKVKKPVIDNDNIVIDLLPLDQWKESHLEKHVTCGKKWGSPYLMILWVVPIILIIISLIVQFSVLALVILVSLIAILAGLGAYTIKRVCPDCTFREECHAAF